MADQIVGKDEFREWVAPQVDGIRTLTDAINGTRDRHGAVPTATSQAMLEVAEEQGYRNRSAWPQPLTDTHMLGGATLQASTDYVRALAELFGTGHPPLYAHLTLARASLEASVVSAWLNDPAIATIERMKRGLCEFIYSAREVNELGLSADAAETLEWWNTVADSFGWTVEGVRGRPTIDGARRPRIGASINELLEADAESRVGDLLYSRFSAIDHVTWFGLVSAFDLAAAQRNERAGTATVPVTVDGGRFAAYVYYVLRVLRGAAQRRFTLMGWLDQAWNDATAATGQLEHNLLQIAVDNGRISA